MVGSGRFDPSLPVLTTYAIGEQGCDSLRHYLFRGIENFRGSYLFIMMRQAELCPVAAELCRNLTLPCLNAWYFDEALRHPGWNPWLMLKINLWRHLPPQVEKAVLMDSDMLVLHPVSPTPGVFLADLQSITRRDIRPRHRGVRLADARDLRSRFATRLIVCRVPTDRGLPSRGPAGDCHGPSSL